MSREAEVIGRRDVLWSLLALAAGNASAATSSQEEKPPVKPPGPVRHKQLLTIPLEHRVIRFDPGESVLTPAAATTLDAVSEIYKPHPKAQMWLHGYGEREERALDLLVSKLARQRAEVARDYLVARGVESIVHIFAVGPGGIHTAPIPQGTIQPARFVYIQAMPWMY